MSQPKPDLLDLFKNHDLFKEQDAECLSQYDSTTLLANHILEQVKSISNLRHHLAGTAVEEWYHMCLAILTLYYPVTEIKKFITSENCEYIPKSYKEISDPFALLVTEMVKVSIQKISFYDVLQNFSIITPYFQAPEMRISTPIGTKASSITPHLKEDIFEAVLEGTKPEFERDASIKVKSFSLIRGILGRCAEIGILSQGLGKIGGKQQPIDQKSLEGFIIDWAREIKTRNPELKSLSGIASVMLKTVNASRWEADEFKIRTNGTICRILKKAGLKKELRR